MLENDLHVSTYKCQYFIIDNLSIFFYEGYVEKTKNFSITKLKSYRGKTILALIPIYNYFVNSLWQR